MRNKSAVKRDQVERTPLNPREFEFYLISKKNSRKTCKYLMDILGSVYSRAIVGLSWDTEGNEYFYPLRSIHQLLLPISFYLSIYIYHLLFICLLSIYHLLFILFLSVCLSTCLSVYHLFQWFSTRDSIALRDIWQSLEDIIPSCHKFGRGRNDFLGSIGRS